MGVNSSYRQISQIVDSAAHGEILFPDVFDLCGSSDAIRSGLSRMCKDGKLKRFAKGIYYIPQYDKWDGSLREPALDEIAQRIATRDNARIIPSGAHALNKLGLSTQVPSNVVYITDGSARKISFGADKSITFRHSNDLSYFAYHSVLMQLSVVAMREIGENALTDEQLCKIKSLISQHVSEDDYRHDIVLAPIWIKKLLQR